MLVQNAENRYAKISCSPCKSTKTHYLCEIVRIIVKSILLNDSREYATCFNKFFFI